MVGRAGFASDSASGSGCVGGKLYVRGCRHCFCPGILKAGDQREEEGGAGRLSLSLVVIRFSRFYRMEKVVEGPC